MYPCDQLPSHSDEEWTNGRFGPGHLEIHVDPARCSSRRPTRRRALVSRLGHLYAETDAGELWRTYGEPARGRAAPGRPCTTPTAPRTSGPGARRPAVGQADDGAPLPRSRATRPPPSSARPEYRAVASSLDLRVPGLRVSEALSLRWADVDLDAGTLRVRGTKTAASAASVPMAAQLVTELRCHRQRLAERASST